MNAELDEAFRRNLAELLDDSLRRDRPAMTRIVARMRAVPNAAAEVNRRCPAPVARGNPRAPTTVLRG